MDVFAITGIRTFYKTSFERFLTDTSNINRESLDEDFIEELVIDWKEGLNRLSN